MELKQLWKFKFWNCFFLLTVMLPITSMSGEDWREESITVSTRSPPVQLQLGSWTLCPRKLSGPRNTCQETNQQDLPACRAEIKQTHTSVGLSSVELWTGLRKFCSWRKLVGDKRNISAEFPDKFDLPLALTFPRQENLLCQWKIPANKTNNAFSQLLLHIFAHLSPFSNVWLPTRLQAWKWVNVHSVKKVQLLPSVHDRLEPFTCLTCTGLSVLVKRSGSSCSSPPFKWVQNCDTFGHVSRNKFSEILNISKGTVVHNPHLNSLLFFSVKTERNLDGCCVSAHSFVEHQLSWSKCWKSVQICAHFKLKKFAPLSEPEIPKKLIHIFFKHFYLSKSIISRERRQNKNWEFLCSLLCCSKFCSDSVTSKFCDVTLLSITQP